jgi:serine/threonine protein kinase
MNSRRLFCNRFRLAEPLGQGGMGVVYRAHDTLLQRDVAIKVFSGGWTDADDRLRLLHEAQVAAGLSHPNIVTIFDVGETEGTPFIVMELIEGESLRDYRLTDLGEITVIAKDLCAALHHAHIKGVIHRDLKPENVMITGGGTIKLMDFGLARSLATRLADKSAIIGTLRYMAPEMILGEDLDRRADLYALGVMLYEMTTGEPPFANGNAASMLSQILYDPFVPPQARNSAIPTAPDHLIVRLLAKRPGDRPASASQVLENLKRLKLPGNAFGLPHKPAQPNGFFYGRPVCWEPDCKELALVESGA